MKLARPKRIEFYKRIPQETIPMAFHAIIRNKRRSFAMLAGILLATSLLSGIILYNNELKQNNYNTIIGDYPFEARFDVIGNESYTVMSELSDQLLSDDRVTDTTIIGTVNSNARNNWLESVVFSSSDLEEVEPTGTYAWPFFVDDDFFSSKISNTIKNMDFQGSTNLSGNSIIVSEQMLRDFGLVIGDKIPSVNFTQIIYGNTNKFFNGYIANVTVIGTYNGVGINEDLDIQSDISNNPFYGQVIYMSLDILENDVYMRELYASMLNTGNFYVAVKLDVTKFSVGDPQTFSTEINQFINQQTKISNYDVLGYNTIEGTLIGFSIFSVFVTILYIILAIPVILLSLYLLNFGLEMSLEERRRLIAIKKTQGANSSQIFGELRNETILLLLIGSTIGYIGGILSAWIISSATGFMKISVGNFMDFVNYARFDRAAFLVPLISVSIILIAVTYKKGRSFIVSEVTEGVTRRELKEESFYRRNKLDIILFVISFSGIALILINELKIQINISIFSEALVFMFTPFLFWIGGSSVGSRLVKIVPLKLENSFLRLPIFKDVKRIIKSGLKRRGDIDRLAMIIILTLSIASLATIQGNTEEVQAQRTIDWQVGADWQINYNVEGNLHNNVSSITGIDDSISLTSMRVRSLSSSLTVVAYENEKELKNLKEDNPIIHWQKDNFDKYTPQDALQALEDNPEGVFVATDHLFILDAKVGDFIEIKVPITNSTSQQTAKVENIKILGVINQLPGGISYSMLISQKLMLRFQALSLEKDINAFDGMMMNASRYYAKTVKGIDITDEEIRKIQLDMSTIASISSARSYEFEVRKINTTAQGYGVTGLLSLNFIISLVAAIVSAFSFSAILMERRKQEFAILRAIGAKKKHIYKLAMGENTLMMTVAAVWGIFIGIGISYLFNGVFVFVSIFVSNGGSVARSVVLPVVELTIICLITLFGMIGATILSIRSAANQDLALATKVV